MKNHWWKLWLTLIRGVCVQHKPSNKALCDGIKSDARLGHMSRYTLPSTQPGQQRKLRGKCVSRKGLRSGSGSEDD
jgi:hypothetical protein